MDLTRLSLMLSMVMFLRCSCEDPVLQYCNYLGDSFKQIQENVLVGTVVGDFKTTGNNSQIELKQEDNAYFYLDFASRNITVEKELDADTGGQQTIDFIVYCVPKEKPVRIKSVVSFYVGDVNDNSPNFTHNVYSTSIREDAAVGTTVFNDVSATDADIGDNGRVYYSIVPGEYTEYFDLRSDSEPIIVLKEALDYERVTNITFQIVAENIPLGESKRDTASIVVSVLNVDDMGPAFSHTSYAATITEGAELGTTVVTSPEIHAEDQDGVKKDIKYSIVSGAGFSVNSTTGEITITETLPPGIKSTSIVLEAQQVDDSQKTNWAVLQITILGSENMAPIFQPSNYSVIVSELEPTGATLVTVTAKDDDTVIYDLAELSSIFEIDSVSGNIRLTDNLDYETLRYHILEVTASDNVYTATATVTITVTDVNDHNPEVDVSSVDVVVGRLQGAHVHTIHASDLDEDTVFSYALISETEIFSVDANGVVTITGTTEAIKENTYHLLVKVRDNGKPFRETSVWIIARLDPVTTLPPITIPSTTTQRSVILSTEATHQAVVSPPSDDLVVIILGALVGIQLLVIIILIIFIKRRRINYQEQLNKARLPRSIDPKGLAYINKKSISPPLQSGRVNLGYDSKNDGDYLSPPENLVESRPTSDLEERSDGGTTTQENPFSLNGVAGNNQEMLVDKLDAYQNENETENMRGVEEIHIHTAVLPLDKGKEHLQNGGLSTFKPTDTDSSDSSDSSSGSKRDLWPTPSKKCLRFKNPSSESLTSTRLSWQGSEGSVSGRLKDGTKDKPEITVYF